MDTDRHAVASKRSAAPEGAPPGSEAAAESSRRHVFISYSRKDRTTADAVVRLLEARGHRVWIDREDIPGGQNFGTVVDSALDTAGAVVVLWSRSSAASAYVQDEADRANARSVMVAGRIDDVRLPLGFGRLQTYDLKDWDRESPDHPEFRRLLNRVRDLAGGKTRRGTVIVGPSSRMALRSAIASLGVLLLLLWLGIRASWIAAAGVAVFAALVAVALYMLGRSADLRAFARGACSRAGAAALLAAGLACWTIVPIRLSGPPEAAGRLVAEARSSPDVVAGPAPLDSNGSARFWVFAPPWGRNLALKVTGHAERDVKLFPWSPARFALGGDLVPDPALFVRFSPDAMFFVTDATIKVLERGVTLATASLGEASGAAIVGPAEQIDLPSRAAAWTPALEKAFSRPAKREAQAKLWMNPVKTAWKQPPSSVFAKVRILLTTKTDHKLISKPIALNGAWTDEEISLEEDR